MLEKALTVSGHDLPPAVEQSLERIRELDGLLRAVIAVDPDASVAARTLEAERRHGTLRGPLHGMPVLVKDNIDTAGNLPTTAGSLALAANVADEDATVVRALRRGGAVVIGKTNLSEWANFRSTRSTGGWSAVGGLTVNPYALDRSAAGSSSGSAAAVAAGLAPVAIGTETDGSIICPAALCGVIGLKPTAGLVDRSGVVPVSHSQDSVGPITRTVRLAAEVLDAIAGGGHAAALAAGASGLRVGVPRSLTWGQHGALDAACEAGLAALAAAGVSLVDEVALAFPTSVGDDELLVLLVEFRAGLESYLASHPRSGLTTLAELVEFNTAHPAELAHFGQELFERALEAPRPGAPDYLAALERCRRAGREEGIDAALRSAGLDALVMPTCPPPWKTDLVNGDPRGLYTASRLPAIAGYPVITVPVGLAAGLPVGMALVGTAHSESLLLRLAAAVEQRIGPLPPPTFRAPAAG